MKNFQNFTPQKYMTSDFQKISDGIYKTKSPYDSNDIFVTSLTFEMEPECYGEENASPSNLTQIPNTKQCKHFANIKEHYKLQLHNQLQT